MTPAIGDKVTVHIAPMFPRRKGAVNRIIVHHITKIHTWGSVELENGATHRIDSLKTDGNNAWIATA